MMPKTDILIRIRPSTSLKYKAVAKASRQLCNVRSSAQKEKESSIPKLKIPLGWQQVITGSKWTVVKEEESQKEKYEIEITHREKKETPKHAWQKEEDPNRI